MHHASSRSSLDPSADTGRPLFRFGAEWLGDGTRFRLFAPDAPSVTVELEGHGGFKMARSADGFHEAVISQAAPGTFYRFRVGDQAVPDPASRMQAEDAEGWSVVVGGPQLMPRPWRRPWTEAVIAEVHVGTATPEGTFRALIDRLDHYRDAGFTVIELLPVADFPGRRNWGYDGVLLYAPDRAYGTPDDLRALIDAAHARGIGMMLDVVYNHFGPRGNYLPLYARSFFREDIGTPWGAALNLESEVVRGFFVENAAYWLADFGFDGLRFDAVHAFATDGAETFLRELAEGCRAVRPDAFLVLENHDNVAGWMSRDDQLFTAQWNDDWHHVFHVMASGEQTGYYAPYARDPAAAAERALGSGFVFQGEAFPDAGGHPRGTPSGHLPPDAFVSFVQNHDHIGNRPLGDRLAATLSPERLAFLHFVLMLSPQIPLLFMGEEAQLPTPFPFFCDFDGELADAVRNGRRSEFGDFFAAHGEATFPDPLDDATFEAAKLRPEDFSDERARAALDAFRRLAGLRRDLVWPLTASAYEGSTVERHGEGLCVSWHFAAGTLVMALNAASLSATVPLPDLVAGLPADAHIGEVDLLPEGSLELGAFAAVLWSRAAA